MHKVCLSFLVVTMIVAVSVWSGHVGGAPSKQDEQRLVIVPVVILKPGEKTELLMSTSCTLGVTRGGGLNVREMISEGKKKLPKQEDQRVWQRGGLTVEVPNFEEGPKQAASSKYEAFKKDNLNVFAVKISAAADTKPGVYNMHLADATCNGHCETDFRVLVVAE